MLEIEVVLQKTAEILLQKKLTLSVAESCTGGLISSLLTDIPGSSAYTKVNFVTYSNEAKKKYLGVKSSTLQKYGEVSEQSATEMAVGLLKNTRADFSLATTGIAGDSGGYLKEHVGLIYIGVASKHGNSVYKYNAKSELSRKEMKAEFAKVALNLLYYYITELV